MFRASVYNFRNKVTKKKNYLTKTLLIALALAVGGITGLTSVLAANSVDWSGQGVTDGVLNTSQCDAQSTPYLFWVFTGGPNVSSATITIKNNGTTVEGPTAMTQQGNGAFQYSGGFYDLSTVGASVSYVGTSANPQLVISHGCAPKTADVTLTKTFEQGPFTQGTGGACFTLAPTAGSSDATRCSNTPEWDGLPIGNYTISESTTPAGYLPISDINFAVAASCNLVTTNCVATGNDTAISLGTFQDMLQPGHLQVIKRLGPVATTWTGPQVTFYVCAHNPAGDATALTSVTCNSSTADVVSLAFNTGQTDPTVSGDLAEGYYTVCEKTLSGYTVDHQCQEAQVIAGSVATDNSLTFVNTPILLWCSPGFWATALSQNRTAVLSYLATHTSPSLNLKTTFYSVVSGGAPLKKGSPATTTLAQVLGSPSTYGGPAFNSVADYIAKQLGWGGTQLTGENCALNAQGIFTQP